MRPVLVCLLAMGCTTASWQADERTGLDVNVVNDRVVLSVGAESLELWTAEFTRLSSTKRTPLQQGTAIRSGTDIRIEQPGITTWFRETDAGMQQGFDVATRPDGSEPLMVSVDLGTDMSVRQVSDDRLVFFNDDGQSVMSYSGLVAWDADGQDLPTSMQLDCDVTCSVALVVDDSGATYPIVIDPTVVDESHKGVVGFSDASHAVGRALAADGNVVVLGANDDSPVLNQGAAFTMPYDDVTGFGAVTELFPLVSQVNQQFGQRVHRFNGHTLVSAYRYSPSGGLQNGAVDVFADAGGGVRLVPPVINTLDLTNFGLAVASNTTTLAIGGPAHRQPSINSGIVYLYDSLTFLAGVPEQQLLNPGTIKLHANYGRSLAFGPTTLAVGSEFNTEDRGEVWVYPMPSGSGPVVDTPVAMAPAGLATNADYGEAIAFGPNNRLAISAPGHLQGTIFIYEGSGSTFSLVQTLTIGNNTLCGDSLAMADNLLVVGCRRDDTYINNGGTIRTFVYDTATSLFVESEILRATDSGGQDALGTRMALHGSTVFASAPGDDDVAQDAGAVYAFDINLPTPSGPVVDNCPDNDEKLEPEVCGCDYYDHPVEPENGGGMACRHITSTVDLPTVILKDGVYVERQAVVGADSEIGTNSLVADYATVGERVTVGFDVVLARRSTTQDDATLGDIIVVGRLADIGANSSVGSNSTVGYASKIGAASQLGEGTIVGNLVDLSAGAAALGTLGMGPGTVIGRGVTSAGNVTVRRRSLVGPNTSLGALTQVGENVRIRKLSTIGASSGIGDNVRIGRGVQLAGNNGIESGVQLATGVQMSLGACVSIDSFVPRDTLVNVNDYVCL